MNHNRGAESGLVGENTPLKAHGHGLFDHHTNGGACNRA